MAFSIFNYGLSVSRGRAAIGNCCRSKKSSKTGNSLVIAGTIVLFWVWCIVGDCEGKTFHSVGQAEVEEDTTQGSLRDKFPLSLSLRNPLGMNYANYEEDDDDVSGLGSVDLMPIRNDREATWQSSSAASQLVAPGNLNKDEQQRQRHLLRHLSFPSNYGIVHKRSQGARPLSFSTASRDLNGAAAGGGRRSLNEDDEADDEALQREQRQQFSPTPFSTRPVYEKSPSRSGSSDIINSSGESNPGFRIRQKILNLRNQYGDKWLSFAGPYAYRKRQILYRQCFFNPISCF